MEVGNLQLCRGTRVFVGANRCGRFAEGNFPRKGHPLSNDRRERKSKYQEEISCQKPQSQQVYLVKTLGSTGNGSYYNHDGDKREPHNENTVAEFTTGGLWYTVYWRCQKPNHDDCSHETS